MAMPELPAQSMRCGIAYAVVKHTYPEIIGETALILLDKPWPKQLIECQLISLFHGNGNLMACFHIALTNGTRSALLRPVEPKPYNIAITYPFRCTNRGHIRDCGHLRRVVYECCPFNWFDLLEKTLDIHFNVKGGGGYSCFPQRYLSMEGGYKSHTKRKSNTLVPFVPMLSAPLINILYVRQDPLADWSDYCGS